MAYVHEFGIIDCIEENKDYTYEPEKYNCICVDGDLIEENAECKSEELEMLEKKISDAIKGNKWLIHYGI